MPNALDHTQVLTQMRGLLRDGAHERVEWVRANLRRAMERAEVDAVTLSALSGVSAGTIRGFLAGTDSSITNVTQMALALGLTLAELEQPPDEPR
jgi:hypothetical protein